MAVQVTNIFIVLSILVATLLQWTRANPPYSFTEGTYNPSDTLFANCSFNVRGISNKVSEGDIPMSTKVSGAIITYINVVNQKPADQQGTIAKTNGGVGNSNVNFHCVSAKNHGFLFQFEIRGTVPPGYTEPATTGNCLG